MPPCPFSEGEILISRALRELEAAGYLERRRERVASGQIRTRTYFYDVPGGHGAGGHGPGSRGPGGHGPDGTPEPPKPSRPRVRPVVQETGPPVREAAPAPGPGPEEPEVPESPLPALADADPKAVAVLTALRRVDARLVLSAREAAHRAADRTASRPLPSPPGELPRVSPAGNASGRAAPRTSPTGRRTPGRRAAVPDLRRLRTRLPRPGTGTLPELPGPPRRGAPSGGRLNYCPGRPSRLRVDEAGQGP